MQRYHDAFNSKRRRIHIDTSKKMYELIPTLFTIAKCIESLRVKFDAKRDKEEK